MLEAFFVGLSAPAPAPVPLTTLKQKLAWVEGAIGAFGTQARSVFHSIISDVRLIACDLGSQCLRETVSARRPEWMAQFDALQSDYDRGIWVWLQDRDVFDEALARWFMERRRPTASWSDAYEIAKNAACSGDDDTLKSKLRAIVAQHGADEPGVALHRYEMADVGTLLSIAYEERWNPSERIVDGEVEPIAGRVVRHVAVQIEPEHAVMYVVSDKRNKRLRVAIARAIAEVELGLTGAVEALPRRRYNLQRLLDPAVFRWDPNHNIISVCVTSLTVCAPGAELIETTMSPAGEDVRAGVYARLTASQRRLARVMKGAIKVVFGPRPGRSRNRTVTILFNGPESLSMNLNCAEEDLLRARYFEPWGFYVGPSSRSVRR